MKNFLQKFALLGCALMALPMDTSAQLKTSDGEELGILIVGTITNKIDDSKNVALIKEAASGRVTAVRPGYQIAEYLVTEVTGKYIMLEKGKRRTLVYHNKFAGEYADTLTLDPNAEQAATKETYSEQGFKRDGNRIEITEAMRDKLVNQDLSSILMQATAVPTMENGEIIGFRVLQIDKGSIYDKAGLINNDIVTKINDIPLTSVSGAIRLLKSLKKATQVSLDLKRGGADRQLQLVVGH